MKRSAFGFGMEVEVQVEEAVLVQRDRFGNAGWAEIRSGSGAERIRVFASEGRTSFERLGPQSGVFGPEETVELAAINTTLLMAKAPDNPNRSRTWVDQANQIDKRHHKPRLLMKKVLKPSFHRTFPSRTAVFGKR